MTFIRNENPMTNRRFDLVISDIDGCLTPEKPSPFDTETLLKIATHNRTSEETGDGPRITVCTGRPQPYTEAMCRMLGNTEVPCVAENGVWLYHPGTNAYMLDPAITDEHLEVVHNAEYWMRTEYFSAGFTIQPGKIGSISLYHPDRDCMLAAVPDIRSACEERRWPFRISTTAHYINCDLSHVSKGTGVRRLLDFVSIPKERTAGIGDTEGDRFIAEAVGYFACPANAEESLKSRADYVSPYEEARGVLDILGHLKGV